MIIKVVIVDDQELVRAGLEMVLSASPDIRVVGEAPDGSVALDVVNSEVDVVLMDIKMPVMDGVQATAQLTARTPAPKILALTTFDLDRLAIAALRAGASGFLLKDASGAEVLRAIRAVHAGDTVVAGATLRRLLSKLEPRPAPAGPSHLNRLTKREHEVLKHVSQGKSNAEIGADLYLSEATIKTHVRHILAKLEVRDRVQAVVYAFENQSAT